MDNIHNVYDVAILVSEHAVLERVRATSLLRSHALVCIITEIDAVTPTTFMSIYSAFVVFSVIFFDICCRNCLSVILVPCVRQLGKNLLASACMLTSTVHK